ncbi:MAG: type I restriction-modification system subunit M N-terminal domain-containing protein, partial [Akkermansia sp.]|nr:type I restriction-modification system subunit M N-terminal domain-containing protein [Akkermansia sp.]
MEDDKIYQVGTNIQEKATVIWNVANAIFGIFKPHEYGKVILPMTVIKRFHDCLAATHAEVLAAHEKHANLAPGALDMMLMRASGYKFYNTSKFTFDTLVADPNNIEANFRNYLAGFSRNVQDILTKFRFEDQLNTLVEHNALFL